MLKRYDIVFNDHVECILRNLGYTCLGSIFLSDITAIEGYVKTVIYLKNRFGRMIERKEKTTVVTLMVILGFRSQIRLVFAA